MYITAEHLKLNEKLRRKPEFNAKMTIHLSKNPYQAPESRRVKWDLHLYLLSFRVYVCACIVRMTAKSTKFYPCTDITVAFSKLHDKKRHKPEFSAKMAIHLSKNPNLAPKI